MSRSRITWIIILLSASLAGIIAFQLYWLKSAIEAKEERFNQNVKTALAELTQKIQSKDVLGFFTDSLLVSQSVEVSDNGLEENSPPRKPDPAKERSREKGSENQAEAVDEKPEEWEIHLEGNFPTDSLVYPKGPIVPNLGSLGKSLQNLRIPSLNGVLDTLFQSIQDPEIIEMVDSLDKILFVSNGVKIVINQGKAPISEIKIKEETRKKSQQIQKAISRMVVEYSTLEKPLDQRLDSLWLDSVLREGLKSNGIPYPFEYAVVSGSTDSVLNLKSPGFGLSGQDSTYRSSLFPQNVFVEPDYLLVYFPHRNQHIYQSLGWVLSGSALLMLVVILAFGGSVWALIRQKRLSDIKSDFINNMTHEFKTPIATISLAIDSINNSRVIQDPDQIRHFSRIIREENLRMNKQVENVLQMALLDREVFNLRTAPIDVHSLLREAIARVELLVADRQGTISLETGADRANVEADAHYLLTVFLNILDNAIKYSPDHLAIQVKTSLRKNLLIIAFTDRGMGMTRDQQKRIFDKFYRATTGNVHNIKGFGLGLSFARAIMLLHKGDISVQSELGKGSTFELSLPFIS